MLKSGVEVEVKNVIFIPEDMSIPDMSDEESCPEWEDDDVDCDLVKSAIVRVI